MATHVFLFVFCVCFFLFFEEEEGEEEEEEEEKISQRNRAIWHAGRVWLEDLRLVFDAVGRRQDVPFGDERPAAGREHFSGVVLAGVQQQSHPRPGTCAPKHNIVRGAVLITRTGTIADRFHIRSSRG